MKALPGYRRGCWASAWLTGSTGSSLVSDGSSLLRLFLGLCAGATMCCAVTCALYLWAVACCATHLVLDESLHVSCSCTQCRGCRARTCCGSLPGFCALEVQSLHGRYPVVGRGGLWGTPSPEPCLAGFCNSETADSGRSLVHLGAAGAAGYGRCRTANSSGTLPLRQPPALIDPRQTLRMISWSSQLCCQV